MQKWGRPFIVHRVTSSLHLDNTYKKIRIPVHDHFNIIPGKHKSEVINKYCSTVLYIFKLLFHFYSKHQVSKLQSLNPSSAKVRGGIRWGIMVADLTVFARYFKQNSQKRYQYEFFLLTAREQGDYGVTLINCYN